ncbi:MAG TPA: glycosyltransferase, partial [Acidobacteriaceae bacterium]|nr:glycosyltransferase [Acidobacteriaceae bacterium]
MRILHIVGTMSAESGGPAEVARMLVELSPAGMTSEIATCDHPGEPALKSLTCPVHALGNTRPGFFYSAALIPWLRANRARFDGVIVHGLWTYPSYAAWRALAGHTPYIVFAHGMLDPWFKRAYPLKHLKKWLYWLAAQYWILRAAHRVLFTTETERDLARQSFWLSHWN